VGVAIFGLAVAGTAIGAMVRPFSQ
jgi:hypothetical protein